MTRGALETSRRAGRDRSRWTAPARRLSKPALPISPQSLRRPGLWKRAWWRVTAPASGTLSAPVSFTLPARIFTDPLARALIEQRQNLASAPNAGARRHAADMLGAFTIAPERFFDGKRGAYMAIRAARHGILGAKTPADPAYVSQLLWDTAIALERGGLLNAAEELRRLQALLNQAMANGAPQDQIDALLERYNQAMQRYMEALAANPSPPGEQRDNPDAVTMTEADIQKNDGDDPAAFQGGRAPNRRPRCWRCCRTCWKICA